MPLQELTDFQQRMLRTMRIIAFALIQGVSLFLAVAVFVVMSRPADQQPAADLTVLVWLGVGFAVAMVAIRFVVPPSVAENHIRRIAAGEDLLRAIHTSMPGHQLPLVPPPDASAAEKLYPVYMTKLIIGMALLEGGAFFALVAYIVTGHAALLASAVGLLILQLLSFPTRTRVAHWVETQRETHEFVDSPSTLNQQLSTET